jgi:DNA-binding NarL/FixJ family response regulator
MHRLILADDQAIFRAGTARVLALEDDMRIIAQCEDASRVISTIRSFPSSVLIFSTGLKLDLIAERNEEIPDAIVARLGGVVGRGISGPGIIDCVRRVARGQRLPKEVTELVVPLPDVVGAKVRDRLTPKELQIVALIVQGCKNKDIANQLGTKEQVIKNYLRSIYDKIGVSDRLELALFTLHHRLLAEAARQAGNLLQMKRA